MFETYTDSLSKVIQTGQPQIRSYRRNKCLKILMRQKSSQNRIALYVPAPACDGCDDASTFVFPCREGIWA